MRACSLAAAAVATGSGAVTGGVYDRTELWYLNDTRIAAATTTTFTVVWGGTAPIDPMYAATTYPNVNQTTPIGNSSSTFANAATGYIVAQTGWFGFFLICTALAIPGLLLLPKVAPWNEPPPPRVEPSPAKERS